MGVQGHSNLKGNFAAIGEKYNDSIIDGNINSVNNKASSGIYQEK
jgi:hypothetical protein